MLWGQGREVSFREGCHETSLLSAAFLLFCFYGIHHHHADRHSATKAEPHKSPMRARGEVFLLATKSIRVCTKKNSYIPT